MAEKDDCSICLTPMEKGTALFTTECGHTFHFNCVKKSYQQSSNVCPLCRAELPVLKEMFGNANPRPIPIQSNVNPPYHSLRTTNLNASAPLPDGGIWILGRGSDYRNRKVGSVIDGKLWRGAYQLEISPDKTKNAEYYIENFMTPFINALRVYLINSFDNEHIAKEIWHPKWKLIRHRQTNFHRRANDIDVMVILNDDHSFRHLESFQWWKTENGTDVTDGDMITISEACSNAFKEAMHVVELGSMSIHFVRTEVNIFGFRCSMNGGLEFMIYPVIQGNSAPMAINSETGNLFWLPSDWTGRFFERSKCIGIDQIANVCKFLFQQIDLPFVLADILVHRLALEIPEEEWNRISFSKIIVGIFIRLNEWLDNWPNCFQFNLLEGKGEDPRVRALVNLFLAASEQDLLARLPRNNSQFF